MVCVLVCDRIAVHDNINREVLCIELDILAAGIYVAGRKLFRIIIFIDMYNRSILDFLEFPGLEFDRDHLIWLDFLPVLIAECDVYSLDDYSFLTHLGLDSVFNAVHRNEFERCSRSLRKSVFRSVYINSYSLEFIFGIERLSRILFFRLLLYDCLFRLYGIRWLSGILFRRISRCGTTLIIYGILPVCCRRRIVCRCFSRRFRIRCRYWLCRLLRRRRRCRLLLYGGSRITTLISECIHW